MADTERISDPIFRSLSAGGPEMIAQRYQDRLTRCSHLMKEAD
jgi:hypothetical protein